jgi:hypothetical protein
MLRTKAVAQCHIQRIKCMIKSGVGQEPQLLTAEVHKKRTQLVVIKSQILYLVPSMSKVWSNIPKPNLLDALEPNKRLDKVISWE